MKKLKIFLPTVLFFIAFNFSAQNNYWTWMHGSGTTIGVAPVHGTSGVASVSNTPGSRRSPVTLTDSNGNLWLFGGYNAALAGYMNDLWMYNTTNNTWTWVSGSNTPSTTGVYGTQGVASATNYPGARYLGCGWSDNSGNLWFFGGYGYSSALTVYYQNDLWKYNISTNQWTWMKGNSTNGGYGTYGTMGTSAPLNKPGGRYCSSSFKDNSGNLWLFGGVGLGSSTSGSLNDLWKYNPSTNNWTWMKGASVSNQFATYGTQGVASASNTPGGRYAGTGSSDSAGNFFIFGGNGLINNGTGYLNDLWYYNTTSGNWTFLRGATIANQSGVYGTQGIASSTTSPGSRMSYGNTSMVDANGNFLMFGGYGYSGGGAGYLNDTWRYNVSTGQWVWLKGSMFGSQYGQYGTQGTGAAINNPGGRYFQSTWSDNSGRFWLYGGVGYSGTSIGELSDLWKLDLCAIPNVPVSSTPSLNLSRCSGATTTVSASNGTVPVYWYSSPGSTAAIGTGTTYITSPLNTTGSSSVFTFYAEAYTCGPSATRAAVQVTVHPTPTITVSSGSICSGSAYVIVASGASSYTYSGGSQVVSPSTSTSYVVNGSSSQGCASTVNAIANVTVHPSPTITVNNGSICPGQIFTITPSGAASYTFSGGSSNVSPTSTGVFFVTGSSPLGCISLIPAISVIVVNPAPVITVPGGTVCSGSPFSLNPSGASTYTFSSGSPVVTPTANSSYTITGTSALGCVSQSAAIANVSVIPAPLITATGGSICSGSSFTIVASGAVSYTYNNSSPVVSPTITTSYSVNGVNQFGCTSATPAVATVIVFPKPVITVNSGSICKGQLFTIVPSGAVTYSYSSGPIINPLVTTSYSVTGTNAQGCISSVPAVGAVTVNPLPVLATLASTPVCIGQSATLTTTGAVSYTYSGNGSVDPSPTGLYVFIPTASSVFTVTGISPEGCVDSMVYNLIAEICNGINETSLSSMVKVFPNPFSGNLSLQTSAEASVVIINTIGQVIYSQKVNPGVTFLETNNFVNGIYFIRIATEKESYFFKVLRE